MNSHRNFHIKPISLWLLLMFTSFSSFAQRDFDDKNWPKEVLGFGCFYGGERTRVVNGMTPLVIGRNIDAIRRWLDSPLPAKQFLATFVLTQLHDRKKAELSDQDRKQMEAIRKSDAKVPVCSGCTSSERVPLYTLFDNKNKHYMIHDAEKWFDQLFASAYPGSSQNN
jgi:hypothetical protein